MSEFTFTRRAFVTGVASLAALKLNPIVDATPPPARSRFKAIAFDAFPIFDPRPVFALANRLLGEKAPAFVAAWKSRQFEYTWLRALGGQYADFWQVTQDSLDFAARDAHVALASAQRAELMNAYLNLPVWPDAMPVLRRLRASGLKLAFLTNFSPAMLAADMRANALDDLIDLLISTDRAKTFKPDPRAYQLGVDLLGCSREEILFVPFAAWDAAGAKWFGYPTFWVNRLNQSAEVLAAPVDGVGPDLHALENFAGR